MFPLIIFFSELFFRSIAKLLRGKGVANSTDLKWKDEPQLQERLEQLQLSQQEMSDQKQVEIRREDQEKEKPFGEIILNAQADTSCPTSGLKRNAAQLSRPLPQAVEDCRDRALSSMSDQSLEEISARGKVREMFRNTAGTGSSSPIRPPVPPPSHSERPLYPTRRSSERESTSAGSLQSLELRARSLRRSNSTNSMFVGSTLGYLDHQSLLVCVSAVIGSHIRPGKPDLSNEDLLVFIDKHPPKLSRSAKVPEARDVRKFVTYIYERGQLEPEVLIMALVYFERLLRALQNGETAGGEMGAFGDGGLQPGGRIMSSKRIRAGEAPPPHRKKSKKNDGKSANGVQSGSMRGISALGRSILGRGKGEKNLSQSSSKDVSSNSKSSGGNRVICCYHTWRPMALISLVLASKVWDDLSMINADFAQICGHHFSLQQINSMELVWLSVLKYDCKVALSTYAKYYFKLRVMLGTDGLKKGGSVPLSMEKAVKIQQVEKEYGIDSHLAVSASVRRLDSARLRASSLDNFSSSGRPQEKSKDNERTGIGVGVSFEQVVQLRPQLLNTWSH
eukprot:g962.t1